jgi:hypothetical protein
MHGLIRMRVVSPRSLACTQKRQHRVLEVELHQIPDSQISITQDECAIQRQLVLDSMAGKVQKINVEGLESGHCSGHRSLLVEDVHR